MDFIIKRFPQVNTCCLCCSTEIGAKIIGWLEFVGSILYCASIIAGLAYAAKTEKDKDDKIIPVVLFVLAVIFAIFFLCRIALAVLLLLGVYREQLGKVWLWLQVDFVLYVIIIVISLVRLIIGCTAGAEAKDIAGLAVELVLFTIIGGYIITVIKSYYINSGGEFK